MEVFIIVTVLWVFSVCIHEFGHAWAAYCGGDHTVREKGYLVGPEEHVVLKRV